jgi:hypothetical protein
VRACEKSGEPRLPQYQEALRETQADLETTKRRMVELEAERLKLIRTLGKAPDTTSQDTERILNKILDRLIAIEKRLEKMDLRR